MKKVLIIADDLTGALDTSVKFCGRNLKIVVLSKYHKELAESLFEADVFVVNSNTRHSSPEEAYELVYDITKQFCRHGFDFIYKKTDSALRGNIGAELAAVADAVGDGICFVPAYPEMKRITSNGIHYISGTPVADSVFGLDPIDPVKSSSVAEIVSAQTDKNCVLHTGDQAFSKASINIYDAQSDMDLRAVAQALIPSIQCAAGCAGFATILADALFGRAITDRIEDLNDTLLISCGSVNPITLEQIEDLRHKGAAVVELDPNKKYDPDFAGSAAFKTLVKDLSKSLSNSNVLCIYAGNKAAAADTSKDQSSDMRRQQLSANLAKVTTAVLDRFGDLTLMCVGGDTLHSLLQALDVETITPIEELFLGVTCCYINYRGKKYPLITKSGGFGDNELFSNIHHKLKNQHDYVHSVS